MRHLVQDFVQETLGGSLSPFVAYLAESKNLTKEEFAELRQFVQEMEQEESSDA